MNTRTRLLIILLTAIQLITIGLKGAPDNSANWEQFPEGVAVSLTLEKLHLTAHIKNTSNSIKELSNEAGDNTFVSFYYLNDGGSWIRLGEQPVQEERETQKTLGSIEIAPGKQVVRSVRLNDAEAAQVKIHKIKCSFFIYDLATKESKTIESSPQLLTSGP